MNENLSLMAISFSKATYFQLHSNEEHAAASEYRAKALEDAEVGEKSMYESIVLKEKSEKDEIQAMVYEETGEFLGEKSLIEAEESAIHASIVAEDEVSYDALIAESITESELALRNEELALDDIEAVAACEFIPFLDMFCDVVGGVAEVGLHAKAAEEVALASEYYIAATSFKIEEEAEEVLTTKFELKSAEDTVGAGKYEVLAEEELEEAKIEKAAATKMQEDGEMELTKSAEENEMSMAEEANAEEEEVLSQKSLEDAMMHGSRGFIDGMILVLSSFFVISFCALKFLITVTIPAISLFFSNVILPITTQTPVVGYSKICNQSSMKYFLEYISFCILHFGAFISTLFICLKKLSNFYALSLRGKGGVIIFFAMIAALIKSIIMQIIHRYKFVLDSRNNNDNEIKTKRDAFKFFGCLLCFFINDFLFFHIFFIIEVLLIWIVFAPNLEDNNFILNLQSIGWYIWTVFLLIYLALHVWFFETLTFNIELQKLFHSSRSRKSKDINTSDSAKIIEVHGNCEGESKPLLQKNVKSYVTDEENTEKGKIKLNNEDRKCGSKFDFTIHHLQLPLEVLVVLSMIVLLQCTIPQFVKLRPIYLHFWQSLQEHFSDTIKIYSVNALVLIASITFVIVLTLKYQKV